MHFIVISFKMEKAIEQLKDKDGILL